MEQILERQIQLDRKEIKVSCYCELPDGEDKILTDVYKIYQVLNNLMINSLKFTSEGRIDLGYTLKKNKLIFYVKDTGIGIKPKEQKEIFVRFKQVDDSATRKYGGTGLGLAICKGLTELLKGKIWVESDQNKGATFYFSIPYKNGL